MLKQFRGVAPALKQSLPGDFSIHHTAVARFRRAFNVIGARSDPPETKQTLEILSRHRDRLKPLEA